jgi:hypothetical protein
VAYRSLYRLIELADVPPPKLEYQAPLRVEEHTSCGSTASGKIVRDDDVGRPALGRGTVLRS